MSICVQRRNTSKFTGVSFNNARSKYRAQVKHEKEDYYCGCFLNELEAAQAVNAKCVELNIPLKNPAVGLPENKQQVRFKEFKTMPSYCQIIGTILPWKYLKKSKF